MLLLSSRWSTMWEGCVPENQLVKTHLNKSLILEPVVQRYVSEAAGKICFVLVANCFFLVLCSCLNLMYNITLTSWTGTYTGNDEMHINVSVHNI